MRQLSTIKHNQFTPLLYDILIPDKALNNIAQMKCLFVVMEYISLDLKSKLETTKVEWSAEEIKLILYNMLCTINFIHSANIMHRDIKPANILIQDNCKMKFCDFGLSRTIYDVGENETSVAIGDLQKKMSGMMMFSKFDDHEKQKEQKNAFATKLDKNQVTKNGSLKITFPVDQIDQSDEEESKGNSTKKGGEFSAHMVPRWYRPPEIILGNS